MTEWFIYQPEGENIGPIDTATVAQGVLAGKIPRDAHVGSPGGAAWLPILEVEEIAAEVRRIEAENEPVPPRPLASVPPAPPPRPHEPGSTVDLRRLPPPKPFAPPAPKIVKGPPNDGDPTMEIRLLEPSEEAPKPAPEPAPLAPAVEAKKEEKPPFKPDPKYDVLPLAIFGACVVLSVLIGIVGLIARPAAPPPPGASSEEAH